jgi:hypothetical protein
VRNHAELPASPSEFEIIAHAGVHQNYPLDNLTDETCTAARIYPLTHHFIDNTIPAIGEAFQTRRHHGGIGHPPDHGRPHGCVP